MSEEAEKFKALGNEAFKAAKYQSAIEWFVERLVMMLQLLLMAMILVVVILFDLSARRKLAQIISPNIHNRYSKAIDIAPNAALLSNRAFAYIRTEGQSQVMSEGLMLLSTWFAHDTILTVVADCSGCCQ